MKFVPARSGPVVSACAGVVIAEAIDDGIPQGTVFLDEEGFPEGDPNIVDGEEAAVEVFDLEVVGDLD